MKFDIGDRIKLVETDQVASCYHGKIGTVMGEYLPGWPRVYLDGEMTDMGEKRTFTWPEEYFDLLIDTGTRVRLHSETPWNGQVGTVTSIQNERLWTVRTDDGTLVACLLRELEVVPEPVKTKVQTTIERERDHLQRKLDRSTLQRDYSACASLSGGIKALEKLLEMGIQ